MKCRECKLLDSPSCSLCVDHDRFRPRAEKRRREKTWKTKQAILDAYDSLHRGSMLWPPPADPSCAHPRFRVVDGGREEE